MHSKSKYIYLFKCFASIVLLRYGNDNNISIYFSKAFLIYVFRVTKFSNYLTLKSCNIFKARVRIYKIGPAISE